MIIEHDIIDAKAASRFFGFSKTPGRKLRSFHRLMPRIAVGDRHESDRVAHFSEQRGGSGSPDITIVRMGSESNHTNLLTLRKKHSRCSQHQYKHLHLEKPPSPFCYACYGVRTIIHPVPRNCS